jgi:hypothetical protein
MTDRIQILTPVIFTERVSAKNNKYRAADVQGILHREDGSQHVFSLLLMSPRGELGTNVEPGFYTANSELRVDTRDRMRLGFEIVGFTPIKAVPVRAAA